MDHKLAKLIKQWLETPETERDYSVCALYVWMLLDNQILNKNIVAELDDRRDGIEYQLQ